MPLNIAFKRELLLNSFKRKVATEYLVFRREVATEYLVFRREVALRERLLNI